MSGKNILVGVVVLVFVLVIAGVIILQMRNASSTSAPTAVERLAQAQSLKNPNQKIQYYLQGIVLAYNELGNLFYANNNYTDAVKMFQAALALSQNDPALRDKLTETYYALGTDRQSSKKYLEAACAYQRGLEFTAQAQRSDIEKRLNAVVGFLLEEEQVKFQTMLSAKNLDDCLGISTRNLALTVPIQTEKVDQPDSFVLGVILLGVVVIILIIAIVFGIVRWQNSKGGENARIMTERRVEEIASQIISKKIEAIKAEVQQEIAFQIGQQAKQAVSPLATTADTIRHTSYRQRQPEGDERPTPVSSFQEERFSSSERKKSPTSQSQQIPPEDIIAWWEIYGADDFQTCEMRLQEQWKGLEIERLVYDEENPNNWRLISIRFPRSSTYYVLPRRNDSYRAEMKDWFDVDREYAGLSAKIKALKRPATTHDRRRALLKGLVELKQ